MSLHTYKVAKGEIDKTWPTILSIPQLWEMCPNFLLKHVFRSADFNPTSNLIQNQNQI